MLAWHVIDTVNVHCHIGSLEIVKSFNATLLTVHCHIGSLENMRVWPVRNMKVHCHIGSLEICTE